jgi:hypothetical protein
MLLYYTVQEEQHMSGLSPSPGYYDPSYDPYMNPNPYANPTPPSSPPADPPAEIPASEYDYDHGGYRYDQGGYGHQPSTKREENPKAAQEIEEQRQREVQVELEALYDLTNKTDKDAGDLEAIKRHLKKYNDLQGTTGQVPGFMPREFKTLAD